MYTDPTGHDYKKIESLLVELKGLQENYTKSKTKEDDHKRANDIRQAISGQAEYVENWEGLRDKLNFDYKNGNTSKHTQDSINYVKKSNSVYYRDKVGTEAGFFVALVGTIFTAEKVPEVVGVTKLALKEQKKNTKAESSGTTTGASKGTKVEGKGPNPNGKNGGSLHQGKIQETADKLKNEGYDVSFEKYVKTPGGNKTSRYGDVLATNPETGEQFIIQVGKQTKAGKPISRESKAIQDLENVGWKVEFVPYN